MLLGPGPTDSGLFKSLSSYGRRASLYLNTTTVNSIASAHHRLIQFLTVSMLRSGIIHPVAIDVQMKAALYGAAAAAVMVGGAAGMRILAPPAIQAVQRDLLAAPPARHGTGGPGLHSLQVGGAARLSACFSAVSGRDVRRQEQSTAPRDAAVSS